MNTSVSSAPVEIPRSSCKGFQQQCAQQYTPEPNKTTNPHQEPYQTQADAGEPHIVKLSIQDDDDDGNDHDNDNDNDDNSNGNGNGSKGDDDEHEPNTEPEAEFEADREEHAADHAFELLPAASPDVAERAMARAQVRAQAYVSRASSSDALAEPEFWRPLARKKSGELVKSSLRSRPELTRTKSEPMRKAVHFNQKLEDVRPFRKTQRPSAVNPESHKARFRAGGSSSDGASDDGTDNDDDFDGDSEEESGWTLLTPGFVPHRFSGLAGAHRPVVYLDALQLTSDKSAVSGTIYVRNLSFHKDVAVRYTIDAWNTFSEAKAVWNDDVRKHDRDAGYDRFDMTLPLRCFSPLVLCDTVMFLCVRYSVNGEEFWDNNKGANFELYLRNSELVHSLQAERKKLDSRSRTATSRPGLARSASADPIQSAESVKDILKNAILDNDDDKPLGIAGPPGIPMKRHSGLHKSRYSFEASYAQPPVQPSSGAQARPRPQYDVRTAQQLARSWMPKNAAVPMPAQLRDSERTSPSASPRIVSDQSQFHTWESQSYKEFVSKYCFYTPMPRLAPKKSADDEPGSANSSQDGSPAISSAESSDLDLPAMRGDIALAHKREANRV